LLPLKLLVRQWMVEGSGAATSASELEYVMTGVTKETGSSREVRLQFVHDYGMRAG
jgi:hypothetical protein